MLIQASCGKLTSMQLTAEMKSINSIKKILIPFILNLSEEKMHMEFEIKSSVPRSIKSTGHHLRKLTRVSIS